MVLPALIRLLESRIRAEAEPLHTSFLQFLRFLPCRRQKAQKLQKIFPVAAGDQAHKKLLRSLAALIGLREN